MRPAVNLNVNTEQLPEWYKPQWRGLNRVLSDITKVLANGVILSENMSFQARTVAVTDGVRLTVSHGLERLPIVMLGGGRILCYKVLTRTSNSVDIWCKLPETDLIESTGTYKTLSVRDSSWFIPGDVVRVGAVITVVESARDGILSLRDRVLLNGMKTVSLYQESIDLLLF